MHDFDYLQSGFPALLAQGLSAYPGVAVLEIEEVRAIGRELELSGGELSDRVVPVILEGEYRMSEQARAVAPSAAMLDVTVKAAGTDRDEWTSRNRSLAETSTWLTQELPDRVLKLTEARPRSLTRRQQFDALTKRSDMFALVGAWIEAIQLRESALLLEDELVEQFRLIGDYRRGMKLTQAINRKRQSEFFKQKPSAEESRAFNKQVVEMESPLIDRLIQRIEQRLAAGDVNIIEGSLLWSSALITPGVTSDRVERRRRHEIKRRVFWDNIPRLKQLDASLRNGEPHPELRQALDAQHTFWQPTRAGQTRVWTNTAMQHVLSLESQNRFLGLPFEPASVFRDIERLLRECAPWPVPAMVLRTLPRGYSQMGGGEMERTLKVFKVSDEDIATFYQQLASSEQTLLQIYGRIGLLSSQLELHQQKPPEPPARAVIGELKLLRALLLKYAQNNPDVYDAAAEIDGRLLHVEVIATRGWSQYTRWRAKQWEYTPPTDAQLKEHERWVRKDPASIRFQPINSVKATWDRLVACGSDMDAVFRSDELWLMRQPGELESIFKRPTETDHIQSAVWDGRWLWVTTDESGLRVFDRDGRRLGHLPPAGDDPNQVVSGARTLPPYRPGIYAPSHYRLIRHNGFQPMTHIMPLRICPLGDGRCVVAGTFGELKRLWICLVSLDESGQWSVEIVHQGRKIPTPGDDAYVREAGYAFDPTWIVPFELPGPTPKSVVLIGRNRSLIDSKRLPPLVLDLESRDVSVLPTHFEAENNRWSPVLPIEGQLFHKGRYVLETLQPDASGDWKLTVMDPSPKRFGKPMQGPLLRASENTFVVPDYSGWTRIHKQPWQMEYLKHDPSQPRVNYQLYGASAHFGLVTWLPDGPLMRVVIDDARKTTAASVSP